MPTDSIPTQHENLPPSHALLTLGSLKLQSGGQLAKSPSMASLETENLGDNIEPGCSHEACL